MSRFPTLFRLLVGAWAIALAACASSPFDRHFEAGRWNDAARAFEADSSLHHRHDALYRAALVYGTPASDAYQPVRARQLLERVLALAPSRDRQEAALGMIRLLDEVERVRRSADQRDQHLRTERDALEREAARLRDRIVSLERRFNQQGEQNDRLRRLAARLAADLREREQRIDALGEELDRLKEIDLRPPPRPD